MNIDVNLKGIIELLFDSFLGDLTGDRSLPIHFISLNEISC